MPIMNNFPYYRESQIKEMMNDVFDSCKHLFHEVKYYFISLPTIFRTTFLFLLFLAIIGIFISHIKSILKNKGEWKIHQKSNLMFSYYCGTGALQRKLIYKDAYAFLCDRKWSWVSIAGLAYRLGNYTHTSKIILFICSLVYLPAVVLGIIEMMLRIVIGTIWLIFANITHRIILLILKIWTKLLIPICHILDKAVRIDQHCPHCYETFDLPAFRCPKCREIHYDLFPSSHGIMFARCKCGYFMASSVYTGRSHIDAVCPVCKTDLVVANAEQFSIQLVGGNMSGKTAFLASFQHLYLDRTFDIKKLMVYGNPQEYFDDLELMFKNGQTKPSSSISVVTYSFLHKIKRTGKYNLVFYDIPDEALLSRTFERNPRNMGFTNGIVIIIDPLGVASVRNEYLKSSDKHEIDNHSTDDINELIIAFVQQYSSITGSMAKRQIDVPVAILINKADVKVVKREIGLPKIKATYIANPRVYRNDLSIARDKICRNYLEKLGFNNVLNNLDGIFSNVRFFPISAIGHLGGNGKEFEPFGVIAPIAWITKAAKAHFYKYIRHAQKEEL